MRILIVTNSISLWSGGHSRNIHFLAKHLALLGNNVTVLTHLSHLDTNHFNLYRIKILDLKKYNIIRFGFLARKYLLKHHQDYDIVHANAATGFAISHLQLNRRPPLVVHFRNFNKLISRAQLKSDLAFRQSYLKILIISLGHYIEWLLDLYSLKHCEGSVSNSCETLKSIKNYAPKRTKLIVLENGITLPINIKKTEYSSDLSLGYFANCFPLKGWLYFISILKELIIVYPNIKIHIAGGGPHSDYIFSLIKKLLPISQIYIHHKISNESEKSKYFNQINLFLCPTSPGTTSTEALSYGVPLIVAKRSNKITDGLDINHFLSTGSVKYLLDKSPNYVASEIIKFHKKPKGDSIEKTLSILLKKYDWDFIAEKAQSFYTKL